MISSKFRLEFLHPIKKIAFNCSSVNLVPWDDLTYFNFALMHNLFHTQMPCWQQISSVSETQHQASSGKYALRTFKQANSSNVDKPDKMPLQAGTDLRAVFW